MSTDLNKLVEKHFQELNRLTKNWEEAGEASMAKIRDNYRLKRNQLMSTLDNQKAKERELINNFKATENQLTEELKNIKIRADQMDVLHSVPKERGLDKRQLLDSIFNDAINDVKVVMDRHQDKFKRMEQVLAYNASKDIVTTKSLSPGASLVNQLKSCVDIKERAINESISQLKLIRNERETKEKLLEELEKKRSVSLEKANEVNSRNELNDRKKNLNELMTKAKVIFN